MKETFYDIIILDTGFNKNHSYFNGTHNIDSIKLLIDDKGKIYHEVSNTDNVGHGTAVTTIIESNLPEAKKLVVNFYDLESTISENLLYAVLNYVYDNIKGAIINLSFGVEFCENKSSFHKICKKLTKKGFIIVAAMGNKGDIVYPAAFSEVISVATDRYITKFSDYSYFDGDDILNIATFGINLRLPWKGNDEYKFVSGSSFSCAYITSIISKIYMEGYKDINEIKKILKSNAKTVIPYCNQTEILNKQNFIQINKAILFPFNKEMHSLIRYNDLLDFEIVGVYDVIESLKVGLSTCSLMSDQYVRNFIVKNINNVDWDSFDTIIIGHCDELELRTGNNGILSSIIELSKKNKKQVYSFDNIEEYVDEDYKLIKFPKITKKNLPPKRLHMLFSIGTPIVGIFGTGSQQGKFTLQLEMRKRFNSKGYNVGQIGTEPSSLLYGMDYMYPIGYNCLKSVQLSDEDVVKYVNYILHELDNEEKDIIIVGSQGGTIPQEMGNLMDYDIRQSVFLKSTWPDIVILCINYDDDLGYISRTISSIESTVNCKIIAIAFLPFSNSNNAANLSGNYKRKLISEELISEKKQDIKDNFGLNSFLINSENDLDELMQLTIDYLS